VIAQQRIDSEVIRMEPRIWFALRDNNKRFSAVLIDLFPYFADLLPVWIPGYYVLAFTLVYRRSSSLLSVAILQLVANREESGNLSSPFRLVGIAVERQWSHIRSRLVRQSSVAGQHMLQQCPALPYQFTSAWNNRHMSL
jgi:hypothetical protein